MISIIIPVYNGEKYIKQCLDCLLSEGTEDILEVIAINDGSRDSSSAMLHEYEASHKNLRVVDKENGGAAQARKLGIQLATGEYIGFLDVDDRAEPQMYVSMLEKAKSTDADIVFCNYTEVFPDKTHVVKNKFKEGQTFPLSPSDAMDALHRRQAYFPFPWNKLYRAELIRSIEFPSGNFVGEDYDMQLKLLSRASRVEYVDIEGYFYVMTVGSASRGGYGEATVRAYEHFEENYKWICENHPGKQKECSHYLITEYMAMIIAMGRNNTYNPEMIKAIKRFVRRGLFGFISAGYVSVKMKGSALALTLSYRLLILMYKILG